MEQTSRRLVRPQHVHKIQSQSKTKRRIRFFRHACLVLATVLLVTIPWFLIRFVSTGDDRGRGGSAAGGKSTSTYLPFSSSSTGHGGENYNTISSSSCAICFFGLPRSFKLFVLPSIIKNVLIPNLSSRCDIFLHYYDIKTEEKSRSGLGGTIDTNEVYLLKDAVDRIYNTGNDNITGTPKTPIVGKVQLTITKDTNETFWDQRHDQIHRYMNKKGEDGKLLYFPWMAKSYDRNSVINVIKQWHSIESVFESMEHSGKKYDRVAMLRNDVVFVTPFDIWKVNSTLRDTDNQIVTVPNWARFPINDRLVYGPASAVKIWSTERFQRLEDHVRTYPEPGYGLHSERFLDHSIFPAIRQELGYEVSTNPQICFFRARSDGSCWINDCATRNGAALGFRTIDTQKLVEGLVETGTKCIRSKYTNRIVQLKCTPPLTKPQ